jgi:hypothetical protein
MKRNEISANYSEREGYEIVRISANDFQSAFSVRNRPVVHVMYLAVSRNLASG